MKLTQIIGKAAYESHLFLEDNTRKLFESSEKGITRTSDFVLTSSGFIGSVVYDWMTDSFNNYDIGQVSALFGISSTHYVKPNAFTSSVSRFFGTYNTLYGLGHLMYGVAKIGFGLYDNNIELADQGFMDSLRATARLFVGVPALLRNVGDEDGPNKRNKKRKKKAKEVKEKAESVFLQPNYRTING